MLPRRCWLSESDDNAFFQMPLASEKPLWILGADIPLRKKSSFLWQKAGCVSYLDLGFIRRELSFTNEAKPHFWIFQKNTVALAQPQWTKCTFSTNLEFVHMCPFGTICQRRNCTAQSINGNSYGMLISPAWSTRSAFPINVAFCHDPFIKPGICGNMVKFSDDIAVGAISVLLIYWLRDRNNLQMPMKSCSHLVLERFSHVIVTRLFRKSDYAHHNHRQTAQPSYSSSWLSVLSISSVTPMHNQWWTWDLISWFSVVASYAKWRDCWIFYYVKPELVTEVKGAFILNRWRIFAVAGFFLKSAAP